MTGYEIALFIFAVAVVGFALGATHERIRLRRRIEQLQAKEELAHWEARERIRRTLAKRQARHYAGLKGWHTRRSGGEAVP